MKDGRYNAQLNGPLRRVGELCGAQCIITFLLNYLLPIFLTVFQIATQEILSSVETTSSMELRTEASQDST